jgi:hypothetical protein
MGKIMLTLAELEFAYANEHSLSGLQAESPN